MKKTKPIRLGGVRFYNKYRQLVPHHHPQLASEACFVWVLFEDQENGEKFDSRTQGRSGQNLLCPVWCFARAITRVRKYVPGANDQTLLSSIRCKSYRGDYIYSDYTLWFIKRICSQCGGARSFGFDESEIGNKSIRSGAAMSLFLMNHSTDKIMVLGRWKSKAFLDYIRPQIIEWSTCLSKDMVSFDSFSKLISSTKRSIQEESERRNYRIPNYFLDM